MLRFRLVEPFGPAVPVQLHISLHRDHRHAKRLHDLFGFYRATHDHLAGEHTEASHVLLFVLEHWHVAVDITHPARLFLYCDLSVDLRHPGRKNRQLKLRHPPLIPQRSLFCKCLPRIISFSPTGQNLRGEIRRSEPIGTKIRRQKPDPSAGPALASGGPPGALLHQSTTGTRAASKVAARTTARTARSAGAGQYPTSNTRH